MNLILPEEIFIKKAIAVLIMAAMVFMSGCSSKNSTSLPNATTKAQEQTQESTTVVSNKDTNTVTKDFRTYQIS